MPQCDRDKCLCHGHDQCFFFNNEVNLLRKFAKIAQIFDKTDDSKGQEAVSRS